MTETPLRGPLKLDVQEPTTPRSGPLDHHLLVTVLRLSCISLSSTVMHGRAAPTVVTSGSPSASGNNNVPQTNSPSYMMRRTNSDDETRRGDDRPTLPPIRDLFGRELAQPPHPSASGTPAHYSPSSHFSQLALPDDSPYRGEQGRSNYSSSHGHAQASAGHGQLRPVAASFHSPQRSQPVVGYTGSPTPAARPFVPFQPELQDPMRSGPTTSSRPGSTPRAPPPGYYPARPMTQSYSGSSSVIPSGLVGPEQSSAKYECQYCGKGFTRPSSLKIHVHSHTGERPFKCTFDGCNRTFSVQSNMRRHARTHLQSGNEARESEGDEESEEGSPQPPAQPTQEQARPPR
ncbi:hypothetical protein BC827DRAFT_1269907 [Russula dissimulans]|nr:hypothetical protein BC827DRAFT_1269907 [Russula dissimulans]